MNLNIEVKKNRNLRKLETQNFASLIFSIKKKEIDFNVSLFINTLGLRDNFLETL